MMNPLKYWHKKILSRSFPERDFSTLKKMNGHGKARVYIASGHCYKIFLRRHEALARRETTMAQLLRQQLDGVEIPDMQLVRPARSGRVVLHYPLVEGELASRFFPRATLGQRLQLADQIGALLARIHTIEIPQQIRETLAQLPARKVRAWQLRRAKSLVEPRYRHLLENRALFREDGAIYDHAHLLHGDFHLFNILVRDGRMVGLIDFGCSQITARSYLDFRKVMYVTDRAYEDRLIHSYQTTSGRKVDTAQVAAGLVARLCIAGRRNALAKNRLRHALERLDQALRASP